MQLFGLLSWFLSLRAASCSVPRTNPNPIQKRAPNEGEDPRSSESKPHRSIIQKGQVDHTESERETADDGEHEPQHALTELAFRNNFMALHRHQRTG